MTTDLPARWRQEAELFRRDAVESLAKMAERHAAELEASLATADQGLLTAGEAAAVSGYTSDHLRRLAKAGRLPDYGRVHAPRYRRGDLPTKPGRLLPERDSAPHSGPATPRDIARAVAHRCK